MEADAARQHSTKFHHHRCGCSDSDVDICVARAIFGQDCPLVWHYFQQRAIHGNVGTDVISVFLNDIGPSMLTPMMFALALATSGLSGLAARCCCPHHIYVICKTEAADEPVTNWNGSVLFVEDLMYDSLRANSEQNKRE